MPERTGRIRGGKVLTLSVDERILGELYNRFATVPGRNVKVMISRSVKAHIPLVSCFSFLESMKESVIKPSFLKGNRKGAYSGCLTKVKHNARSNTSSVGTEAV